jgi:eukaryotic-like serine/threonine-protein kinase
MQSSNLVGHTLLGRFRVDSFIASGGMGAVYKVWDLQRSVYLAMKVLHSDLAEDTVAFRRFKREADDLKNLAHPNIVPFYGLYEENDLNFLLEGFINGSTLKEILRMRRAPSSENPQAMATVDLSQRALPVSEALTYLRALCAPLGYAHSLGVVHCDVKPGNVMVDLSGLIYLADFGISRHMESSTTTLGLTGTPAYMAPEQIRGEKVTPATDIYALGVMLFEMLAGQRPFLGTEPELEGSGDSPSERIRTAHLRLPPPDPRTINPRLPASLSPVILKALEKDPARRYATTNELFLAAASAAGLHQIPDRVPLPFPVVSTPVNASAFPPAGAPDIPVPASPVRRAAQPLLQRGLPHWARTCLPVAVVLSLVGLLILAAVIAILRQRLPETLSFLPVYNTPVSASQFAVSPSPPQVNTQAVPTPVTEPTSKARPQPAVTPTITQPPTSQNEPPAGADHWTSPKDGMLLVRIPAGPFMMGSNRSPWDFESPEHTVTLDEYWIDRIPVTNALFAQFVAATGHRTQAEQVGWGYVSPGQGEFQTNGADWRHPTGPSSSISGMDNFPVVQVSWEDAHAYCEWAGRRLPTEAEWEKAARGEDGRLYPWGDTIDCVHANYSNGSKTYCTGGLTAADAYPSGASPYGVLDMAGNSFDWVADWYQADYYKVAPDRNPTGPATGAKRVHRGGGWYNFNQQVQTTYRYSNPPDWTFGSVGFRCAYSK